MATQTTKKITIMGLLADCSTDEARALLKKYGMPPAKNKAELELALAKLYKTCDDKKSLEKDFAEIHPHKDFLKKYIVPKPPVQSEVVVEEIKSETTTPNIPPEKMPELVSNCNGNPNCNCCNNSNYSGADGLKNTDTATSTDKDKLIVYGMFGIVSILALVLISQQIKK
jgi:hypothetical protein